MNKDDAIKAMKDRVREGKARKSRMWLDELEHKVKGPAKEQLWGIHASKDKELPPIDWDKY